MKRLGCLAAIMLAATLVQAGTGTLNDYNAYNVNIPDNGSSVSTDLALSGAPSGATITKVKIYYEIRHTYIGDLKVWLTTYYNGAWHDFILKNREGGSADNIIETRDNLTTWNGVSPNQTWYLVAQDMATGATGYIDFFELWVTYSVNDAPNTPSSEDPSDGVTGVSISKDLDWSCSDPNSDTLYYTVYFEKNDSSPDVAIKTDATGSAVDLGALDYDSHYYWQVKADDHKGGVTWGPVWDFYTEPTPVVDADITGVSFDRSQVKRGIQTITATVTLQNTGNQTWTFYVGGSSIKSGDTTWYDWSPARASKSLTPGESGTVQLTWATPAGAPLGMYGFFSKAFKYSTGDEFVDDDWRDLVFEVIDPVNSGQITGISFNKSSVIRGVDTITATVTIRNTGDQSYTFYLGGSSIKSGDTTWYDWTPSRASKTIGAGASDTVAVSWSCPSGAPLGSYGFFSKLFKAASGTDYFDDDWRDAAFQVVEAPLSLHGRIAYHAYSDYMATPVDSIDGNAFVYKIDGDALANVTDTLAVDNSMNPHFSPDGSKITFMAIPSGSTRARSSLEVYVYDLAEGQLSRLTSDAVPDEDPKFSPDGLLIVWKRDGQVWRMQSDGTAKTQLTTTGDEKSGPNYSPDGTQITYWSSSGQSADVWRMNSSGSGASVLVATANVQDYYPIFRDNNNVLYSRWESTSDHHDKLYNVEVSSGISTRLAVNVTGVEDADAAPVDANYLVISSTRSGGKGSYDVLVARYASGGTYTLGNANSIHKDLGACYSQYTYARKLKMQAPANGVALTAGASYTIQVRAYSDGGIWSGTSPSVTFQGSSPQTYSDLRDDGTGGDTVAGDGIYSKSVSLPGSSGIYTVTASAQSVESGVTRQVGSTSISVTVNPANSAPTDISLSPSSVPENQPSGTAVGTLSTTDPDAGNTFTYTLVSGAGSTDNGSLTISGSNLLTAASFDYETKANYSIRVRSTDQGGLWFENGFIIAVSNLNDFYKLTVASAYGGSVPAGTNSYHLNTAVSAMVTNSPFQTGTTQYVCRGWTGTGSAPANGSTTNTGTFIITNDSTIVWRWTTNYWLHVDRTGNGNVSTSDVWVAAGTNIQVTATPGSYCTFGGWQGQTNGCTIASNKITAVMNTARDISAIFIAEMATNNVPKWWLAQYGLTNFNADAARDADLDGLRTWEEYIAGCDPTNQASSFRVQQHIRNVLGWNAVSGRVYTVYWTTNLLSGFQCLESNIPWTRCGFTNQTAAPCGYYKIDVQLAP